MDVRNGAGDFSVIMKTAHISTSLLSFFEMEGIFLCSEDGRIFMSRWTEGEPLTVDMEHFIEWKAEQTEENIYAEEKQQENKIQTAQFDRESDNELRATELPARNFFPQYQWKDIWEQFLKSHPASMPFSEKNITCIKMELKDIRELPRKYWYLGNNSFLLHGFFNYRYLVLGKIEEDNEDMVSRSAWNLSESGACYGDHLWVSGIYAGAGGKPVWLLVSFYRGIIISK